MTLGKQTNKQKLILHYAKPPFAAMRVLSYWCSQTKRNSQLADAGMQREEDAVLRYVSGAGESPQSRVRAKMELKTLIEPGE